VFTTRKQRTVENLLKKSGSDSKRRCNQMAASSQLVYTSLQRQADGQFEAEPSSITMMKGKQLRLQLLTRSLKQGIKQEEKKRT
jgi:hypothetical protein